MKLLKRSIQLAFAELLKDDKVISDKLHWTFIFYKNQYIVHGRNQTRKTHPAVADQGYLFDTLHSETSAFLKLRTAGGNLPNKKLTVVNIRLSKKSLTAGYPITKLSKPCHCCANWLRGHGFKKIIYTKENDSYEIETLR